MNRHQSCNGQLLKSLRNRRGWTQEELAFESELSVRLVAKAENDGSLQRGTFASLALALSTESQQVQPEDLACNPVAIVQEFLSNLKTHQANVVAHSRHLLSDEIVYIMPGDPESLPFAGVHHGIEATDRAIRIFFDMIEIYDLDLWTTEFVSCQGNQVIAAQLVPGQLKGLASINVQPSPPTLVVYRINVARGKIVLFDDHYPTEQAKENARLQALVKTHSQATV